MLDSECVQTHEVSTYQTSTSHKIKNDAATSGSSLHIVDTTVGTQTHGNPNGSNDKSINETQRPRWVQMSIKSMPKLKYLNNVCTCGDVFMPGVHACLDWWSTKARSNYFLKNSMLTFVYI